MLLDLDHTLGCGQVFRWRKEGGLWKGVVGGRMVVLEQDGPRVAVRSGMDMTEFERYFRMDDDLEAVVGEGARGDETR
ncbi:MAG TPA: DNA glycosylase, partial [Methanomassiliicoccales archaeon]|nr:DNA glycosylase [Methanomassiliicoccales archaeon]